jgi:TonB family protein
MATPRPTTPTAYAVDRTPQDVPSFVYLDMQDELRMWRMVALLAVSVAVHVVLLTGLMVLPRLLPHRPAEVVVIPGSMQNRDLTYLNLPPDQQHVTAPPTNVISDKDRMAMSRHPQLTEPPRRILDSARPGAPGSPGANVRPAPQTNPGSPVNPGTQNTQSGTQPPQNTNPNTQVAQLTPPGGGQPQVHFGVPLSPGTQINNAANATVTHGGGGVGGEYGLDPAGRSRVKGDLDILSDTMGVDFGPYLARIREDIRQHWFLLIPEEARPPLMKNGRVYIQFGITKDGQVVGLQVIGPSGDIALDRAAYGGISGSNPFPPLPQAYNAPYLLLRARFYYNPSKDDLE